MGIVKESISFERGKNPKSLLGIGGIDLGKEKTDMIQQSVTELQSKWQNYLHALLDGKIITATMRKLPQFDTTTKETIGHSENKEFTVKIKDWDSPSINHASIVILDENNNFYNLQLDKKIYLE